MTAWKHSGLSSLRGDSEEGVVRAQAPARRMGGVVAFPEPLRRAGCLLDGGSGASDGLHPRAPASR
ncbi:MAG: hypothetical protein EA397_14400 [Deltaproteobacteria bacterium]|nr:MAG: hypothetical protein EA397_14400 [Deltaproteobacteria bacterium]